MTGGGRMARLIEASEKPIPIVLAGLANSGKTALFYRFTEDTFEEETKNPEKGEKQF